MAEPSICAKVVGMTELGSRSDFQALQRSGRGKIVILSAMLVSALGGAAWSFLGRKEGIGNPEDPVKVLVVHAGSAAGYGAMLKSGGFDAAEASLETWERKAQESFEAEDDDDAPRHGLPAVLRLADLYGYGFVAIEKPSTFDFSAVETDVGPPTDPQTRFAVVSVGDLAFPHRLTVHPPSSTVFREPFHDLLAALFEQEPLIDVLPHNEDPSVEVIQRRDRLAVAIDRWGRRARAETLIEGVEHAFSEAVESGERAEVPSAPVSTLHESASALPLPNGGTLVVSRAFSLTTADARRPEVELEDVERFSWIDAGGQRQVCEALLGGQVSVHDSGRFVDAVEGDAILAQTLSDGITLWTWEEGSGCSFVKRGAIAPAQSGLESLGVPHRSGQVARTGSVRGVGVLSVVRVDDDDPQSLLGMLPGRTLAEPVWWDADLLIAPSRGIDGSESIDFFKPSRPLEVLRLPSAVLDGETSVHQLAVLRGPTPGLVVAAGEARRRLYRLEFPADPHALFDDPAMWVSSGGRKTPDGSVRVIELDTNRFPAVALTHEGRAHDPAVSPDGQWVAFAIRDAALDRPDEAEDDEIAIVPAAGGRMHVLTRNGRRDLEPRFTADSKFVLFKSQVEIPRTRWTTSIARRVEVPGLPGEGV